MIVSTRTLALAALVPALLAGSPLKAQPAPSPAPAQDAARPAAAAPPAATAARPAGAPNFLAILANSRPKEVVNSIGMAFEPVPDGSFVMGRFAPVCPEEHPKRPPPMGPPVRWKPADYARCKVLARQAYRKGFLVEIPEPYLMGKTEVTQAQFERVMGYNPSYFKAGKGAGDASNRPADSVDWKDAQAFVAKLNALEHTNVYRLPTEAEWEWAARAGAEATGPWVVFNLGNGVNGWFQGSSDTTAEVGGKKPNGWGLYDMLGNVWEWVADVYNERFLPDPTPAKSGKTHVIKGGSFLRDGNMTFATDHAGGPGNKIDIGFRVMRSAE
jgi:sulfatase modifying factor 1